MMADATENYSSTNCFAEIIRDIYRYVYVTKNLCRLDLINTMFKIWQIHNIRNVFGG